MSTKATGGRRTERSKSNGGLNKEIRNVTQRGWHFVFPKRVGNAAPRLFDLFVLSPRFLFFYFPLLLLMHKVNPLVLSYFLFLSLTSKVSFVCRGLLQLLPISRAGVRLE